MNREFLDMYNRELGLLQEQARAFAGEFPGIAERLGGLLEDRSDPMIFDLTQHLHRQMGDDFDVAFEAGRALDRPSAISRIDPAPLDNRP